MGIIPSFYTMKSQANHVVPIVSVEHRNNISIINMATTCFEFNFGQIPFLFNSNFGKFTFFFVILLITKLIDVKKRGK